jgi:tRNA (guanine-N7-)-methyltransferase
MNHVKLRLIGVTVCAVLRGDSENRLVRTFRPRRRKLGPELSKVYERLKDDWSIAEHGPQLDVSEVFGNGNPVCLEIGCGRGDLAVSFGPMHLDVNLIAIDIHTRGTANILQGIEKQSLVNTRVVEGDVLVLLKRFADASLTEVWVFFPDPWPKPREQRRRLMRPDVVQELARVLKPGGVLRLATDIEDYWRKSITVVAANASFDYSEFSRPEWRIETVFERRGINEGRQSVDICWVRNSEQKLLS